MHVNNNPDVLTLNVCVKIFQAFHQVEVKIVSGSIRVRLRMHRTKLLCRYMKEALMVNQITLL